MVIGAHPVLCSKCGASLGLADRCPNCGWPRPPVLLGIPLRGRFGTVAVVAAVVVIVVVVLGVVIANR